MRKQGRTSGRKGSAGFRGSKERVLEKALHLMAAPVLFGWNVLGQSLFAGIQGFVGT